MCIVAMTYSEKFTVIYSIPPYSLVLTPFFHNVHWALVRCIDTYVKSMTEHSYLAFGTVMSLCIE